MIADAVIRLYDHPEERQSMGRAGIERVKRLFNWARAASEYIDLYKSACSKRPAAMAKG